MQWWEEPHVAEYVVDGAGLLDRMCADRSSVAARENTP
jgi:hypothetical protein